MHDDIARRWDENADTWSRHVRAGYDTFRDLFNNPAFVAFTGDLAGLQVLDAGCGEGYNTRLFACNGSKMTGVDISLRMIELAREEEAREPLGIRYELASITDLAPFADESFDAVISTMALMDAPDYPAAMRAFHRVLRPGSLLAFNILHPCFTFRHIHGLNEFREGDTEVVLRVGCYFTEEPYEETWAFGNAPAEENAKPFSITYFDRTLAGIINPLCDAGFHLEAILEPRPTDEACLVDPRLRKHQLIPQTLCVRARKH